jgi:hypothetical protein
MLPIAIALTVVAVAGCGSSKSQATTLSTQAVATTKTVAGHPTLRLRPERATRGTLIHIVGRNCAKPQGQPDELTWHDSASIAAGQAGKFVRVRPLHRTGKTVTASYRLGAHVALGLGLFDLFCGGSNGNAIAYERVVSTH